MNERSRLARPVDCFPRMPTNETALVQTNEPVVAQTAAPGGKYRLTRKALAFYKDPWIVRFPLIGGVLGVLLGALFASKKPAASIPLATLASATSTPQSLRFSGNLVLTFKNGKQTQLPMSNPERFATAVLAQLALQ